MTIISEACLFVVNCVTGVVCFFFFGEWLFLG